MSRSTFPAFFLLLSLAFNGCFSQQQQQQSRPGLERITAREPSIRIPSEAGLIELWDSNNPEFENAAVQVERVTVQPKGLVLPHHINAHKTYFVVQGQAIHGTVNPGCAETYESLVQGGQQQQGQRQGGQSFVDRHQKLVRVKQGDVVAVLVGHTHWIYNDGGSPLVLVALNDVGDQANQLDQQTRRFWLAGNSQNQAQQEQQGQGQQEHGQSQGQGQHQGQGQGQGQGPQQLGQENWENVWNGFDDELLSNILRVPQEIIRKLKGQQNNRKGGIIRAENLRLSLPEFEKQGRPRQQEQGSGSGPNGLEETICSLEIRENIAHPSRADIYNPRAGRVSTVNSETLPILKVIDVSVVHANLYSNALWAPSWTSNANTVLYVIRGSARAQIVGPTGNAAFNGEVKQGQLILIPQNFVVLKKAGSQGIEFVAFKTIDNAQTNSLAGRLSAIRSLPEDIVSASFQVPKEDAQRLKYGREEALLLSGSESQGRADF